MYFPALYSVLKLGHCFLFSLLVFIAIAQVVLFSYLVCEVRLHFKELLQLSFAPINGTEFVPGHSAFPWACAQPSTTLEITNFMSQTGPAMGLDSA